VKFVTNTLNALGTALSVCVAAKCSSDMTVTRLRNGEPLMLCQLLKSREHITSSAF
jgi:hypothetical protein